MKYFMNRPENLFEEIFNDFNDRVSTTKNLDLYQKDNAYHLEMELPGFKKDEINVDYHNDILTITAKHVADEEENKKNYIYKSRRSN